MKRSRFFNFFFIEFLFALLSWSVPIANQGSPLERALDEVQKFDHEYYLSYRESETYREHRDPVDIQKREEFVEAWSDFINGSGEDFLGEWTIPHPPTEGENYEKFQARTVAIYPSNLINRLCIYKQHKQYDSDKGRYVDIPEFFVAEAAKLENESILKVGYDQPQNYFFVLRDFFLLNMTFDSDDYNKFGHTPPTARPFRVREFEHLSMDHLDEFNKAKCTNGFPSGPPLPTKLPDEVTVRLYMEECSLPNNRSSTDTRAMERHTDELVCLEIQNNSQYMIGFLPDSRLQAQSDGEDLGSNCLALPCTEAEYTASRGNLSFEEMKYGWTFANIEAYGGFIIKSGEHSEDIPPYKLTLREGADYNELRFIVNLFLISDKVMERSIGGHLVQLER